MPHRAAVKTAGRGMGALISSLFLRAEMERWEISDDELVDALLAVEAVELIAILGPDKATEAVQKQIVTIHKIASEHEHVMDSA
jgi:hypothetical protein